MNSAGSYASPSSSRKVIIGKKPFPRNVKSVDGLFCHAVKFMSFATIIPLKLFNEKIGKKIYALLNKALVDSMSLSTIGCPGSLVEVDISSFVFL